MSLAYEASPVMDIILDAAKEGASLYAVTDPSGITHRVWEVKRETPLPPSEPCSTRHRSRQWPMTPPTPPL
ncbi:MAG: hypothetical protein ACLU0O_03530 [Collinsella sp.]